MQLISKSLLVIVFLSAFVARAFCVEGEKIEVKGYYHEDGTFEKHKNKTDAKQQMIDPLVNDSELSFPLSHDLSKRREEIIKYYHGKIITTKVPFPASNEGNIVDIDDLGKSNIQMFNCVNKYGISIEKNAKAIITNFKINPGIIDIEINNGGYGNFKDVSWRVATGILTLGLMELKDYKQERLHRGSRLRIVLKREDSYNLSSYDIDFDEIKQALQSDTKSNSFILEHLNVKKDQLDSLTEVKLLQSLNEIIEMPDFYEKVDFSEFDLPKDIAKLLKSVSRESSDFIMGDINLKKFKKGYQFDYQIINDVLEKSGITRENISKVGQNNLIKAANELINIPNLTELIDANKGISEKGAGEVGFQGKYSNRQKIAEVFPQNALRKHKKISEGEILKLNRELLCIMYPQAILSNNNKFDEDNLNKDRIDKYLSLVFEL
jgi:hypothetical protein